MPPTEIIELRESACSISGLAAANRAATVRIDFYLCDFFAFCEEDFGSARPNSSSLRLHEKASMSLSGRRAGNTTRRVWAIKGRARLPRQRVGVCGKESLDSGGSLRS